MIQQSFNSIVASLLGSGLLEGQKTQVEQGKKQTEAAEKQTELAQAAAKKAEEKEKRDYERIQTLVREAGLPERDIEGQDIDTLWNMYSQEIGIEGLAERIERGEYNPTEETNAERRLMTAVRSKKGQAALHLARNYEAQENLRRSYEERRAQAEQREGGNQ